MEGVAYSWHEYVLFNPYKGFRYLTEYDGHWNDTQHFEGAARREFGLESPNRQVSRRDLQALSDRASRNQLSFSANFPGRCESANPWKCQRLRFAPRVILSASDPAKK